MTIPKHTQMAFLSRLKIISNLDITKSRIPQDGRVSAKINGMSIDMRVSTMPTIHGEKIVIRLFSQDTSLLDIKKLGFRNYNLRRFKKMIKQPNGIILVTGPTGSGKTTTLFAALKEFNAIKNNIVTIEDPVEYKLNNVNQIQTNKKTGLDFSTALRSILRQDPDIVMVGEIRDKETAEIAIRAALTGHLVLSTIHTNDSVSSIMRLIDMGIPPYLIASSLVGILSQRLVRRICSDCKTEYMPTKEEITELNKTNLVKNGEKPKHLHKGEGCKKCGETGYKGRIPILETLIITERLETMIMNGSNKNELQKNAIDEGLITLKENGLEKVIEGLTTYEEIMKTTFNN
jgi:type IV pilus assembly protein PilB